MRFYRLIKPDWARPTKPNGETNPKFIQTIPGYESESLNTIEGCLSDSEVERLNNLGFNAYWFPNHPSKDVYAEGVKHLSGKHIDVFQFLFVDMDLKDGVYKTKEEFYAKLAEFSLKPSMVLDSGNGVHAYWSITDLTRESYVIGCLALLNHFQTDASVWTVLQLLRVPNSLNTKRFGQFFQTRIVAELSSGNQYQFKDLPQAILSAIPEESIKSGQEHLDKLDGKFQNVFKQEVDLDEIPERFLELTKKPGVAKLWLPSEDKDFDRSSADMALANILFSEKFDYKEALAIIANSQKALAKGPHRYNYARYTVDKVYSDRPIHKFESVSQFLKSSTGQIKEPQVYGPAYLDYGVLKEPWRKKELLGVIGGSGIGKTSFVLNILREIIANNPDRDEVFVFFSLEMTKSQIISRWVELVGGNPELSDKLYVVDTQTAKGGLINIGLQEMYDYCTELKQATGKSIGAICIDHFHIISTHIDTRKSHKFGIDAEGQTGYGQIRNLSRNKVASQLKELVKALNTFGIILTQTTKVKGVGDLPIGKEGAHGISDYEWIMDRIVTIWQPLMRVQHLTKLRFTAFQYAKIREKREEDEIKEYEQKLLSYELRTGLLRPTNSSEYEVFKTLLPTVAELRSAETAKNGGDYSLLKVSELVNLIKKQYE